MKTNFDKVKDFNNCFNHKVSQSEYFDVFSKDPKLVILRLNLIKEEIEELNEAYRNDDLIEIIDALTDILYVVYGMCACFGINIDEAYNKYIRSMFTQDNKELLDSLSTKTNYEKTVALCEHIGKMNLDENNVLKDYVIHLKRNHFRTNLTSLLSSINSNFSQLELSCVDEDFEQVIEYILHILKDVYMFGVNIGLNLDNSYTIVHNSNMTKICATEELAKKTVLWYQENDKRYDSPAYRHGDFGYVVYNKNSGKILKSIEYTPADFETLLK